MKNAQVATRLADVNVQLPGSSSEPAADCSPRKRGQAAAGSGRAASPGADTGITSAPQVVSLGLLDPSNPDFPDVRVYRGVDFFKVSYWVDWLDSSFLDLLEVKKMLLQESTETEECTPLFLDCGFDWNLYRRGTGKYKYRLRCGDVTLLLSDRDSDDTMPSIRLEIGSLTSQTKLRETLYDIEVFLKTVAGAYVAREQVSEIHLAADFIGLDIETLQLWDITRWVTRAREFSNHYPQFRFSGCTLGKGDLGLRCYNKSRELSRPGQAHKQQVFCQLWGMRRHDEQPVCRVEYQIRREKIKQFRNDDYPNGVSTPEQVLSALGSFWRYLTGRWAKFMAAPVDRKNKNQCHQDISSFWSMVSSLPWTDVLQVSRSSVVLRKDIDALIKQTIGCLMSVVAAYTDDVFDFDSINSTANELISSGFLEFQEDRKDEFVRRMQRKRNEVLFDSDALCAACS